MPQDIPTGTECDTAAAPAGAESVAAFLESPHPTAFSFEVLPPQRGRGIDSVFRTIDRLMPFGPAYINITTHRTETVFRETGGGLYERCETRTRPGTVAIAAAIRWRYGVRAVPHIICSGFTREETENQLIDLSFLGITDLLVLRGDRAKGENRFVPTPDGHTHAEELCRQVEDFNRGMLVSGEPHDTPPVPFSYGVAGYPEKHDEAMNPEADIACAKAKVEAGARYIVTQMVYDNAKYFDYVRRLREAGVEVPVIPGLKPLTTLGHRSMLPKTFHIDFPEDLSRELRKCRDNEQVKELGVEWGIAQARELRAAGVPSIHFYSMNASYSVERIARAVY